MDKRTVFFISDRTGITAETLGLSLMSQFENVYVTQVTLPFVDTVEKAKETLERIKLARVADGARPIIFATLIKEDVKTLLNQSEGYFIDFFDTFIPSLESELKAKSSHTVGKIHGVKDIQAYNTRIDCVNFALTYDDGAKTSGYDMADVVLVGVSRSGKTPTSLYMAMQYGIRAANFPLTPDELATGDLPKILRIHKRKLFGLTIDPERLQAIRTERRPNSQYADLKQCQKEVTEVEDMFKQLHIPYLSSTNLSIEELAIKIMEHLGLERRFR